MDEQTRLNAETVRKFVKRELMPFEPVFTSRQDEGPLTAEVVDSAFGSRCSIEVMGWSAMQARVSLAEAMDAPRMLFCACSQRMLTSAGALRKPEECARPDTSRI